MLPYLHPFCKIRKAMLRLFAYAPASKRCRLLEHTIIRVKPALVATRIKQATYVKQVCIQVNTLKIPELSKYLF